MEIFIKNMVCGRCLSMVEKIFDDQKIALSHLELGLAKTTESISKKDLEKLETSLEKEGFEILQDSSAQQIEKIKKLILDKVQSLAIDEDFKISTFLSDHLHREYSSLSKLFSQTENVTLEQYFILLKIEKVKELLIYNEYSLTQIADLLGYKTVQHLSAQFKKITGFSPSQFLKAKDKNRKPLDKI